MIKAIETKYKGYRFRSRLEARWAVFFDALGYQWEYEPEGFDLGDGVYYLPDFRISGVDTNGDSMNYWIEVKPLAVKLSAAEKIKLIRFSEKGEFGFAGAFILLDGPPDVNRMYRSLSCDQFIYVMWSHRMRPWWEVDVDIRQPDKYIQELEGITGGYHFSKTDISGGASWTNLYRLAIEKARSARFEHGESPW